MPDRIDSLSRAAAEPQIAAGSTAFSRVLATVMLPFALAHFISYLYRTVNAVVYPELAEDLGLTAGTLGLLTGAYFLTFAAAQIPVGIALDRFGPRRVQGPMLLLAAAGAVLFSCSDSLAELVLARALIGLGVAGSLMAAIKACSLWLPRERLPLATAALLAVGGLGAMASTTPMQWVLEQADWRAGFVGLAVGTIIISSLLFLIVPEHAGRNVPTRLAEMLKAVVELYGAWSFWRLALYTVWAHATYLSIQSLWIGPWLADIGHLSHPEAARVLFACTLAIVAGTLCFGWISDALQRFGFKPILVCGVGTAVFLTFQLAMVIGPEAMRLSPSLIAIGFSFFGTAAALNFAIVAQSVPGHLTGRVSTSFNLLVCLLAFVLQWGLGELITLWQPQEGTGRYPQESYRFALGINLALQVPGLLLWLSFRPWRRN